MKKLMLIVIVLGLFATPSFAGILAGWDVNGVDLDGGLGIDAPGGVPYTFTATTLSNKVDAKLTLGSGVNPSTAGDQYGFKISTTQTDLQGAIDNNHYIQFSLSVESGYQLNLSSIEMNGESTSTGADDIAILSSIGDGFIVGAEIASLSDVQAKGTGGFDTDGSGFPGPIDLSASKYQGLTGTVDFRIYGYNTSGSTGVTRIRYLSGDDLIVNGTVIPEPATLTLLGLVAVAAILRRKLQA